MSIEFKPTLTFEFNNSKSLLENLLEEYSDFDKNPLKSRFAMNCAINSWHLSDWTFQEFFIKDERFLDSESVDKNGKIIVISGLLKYQQYLTRHCPELEYMRLITNGTKHCIIKDKSRTEKTEIDKGHYSSLHYSRHHYNVSRFVIEKNNKVKIDFEETLLKTINFWKQFLSDPK